MADIKISTSKVIKPMIYAYTTPEIDRHKGWTKIGYTEQDVETRIKQQTHTADVRWELQWKGSALYDDGSFEMFTDKDFHAYLRKAGVQQDNNENNEWFHITGIESNQKFNEFRSNHGVLKLNTAVLPYMLREEQNKAVDKTVEYFKTHKKGEFLWNAKPRFGKTLSVYDFCKRINAVTVLIVTNRPAIANSWYSDYIDFMGEESGYLFVSEVEALKNEPGVLSHDECMSLMGNLDEKRDKMIEFVSLQNLKGARYFGGVYNKLEYIKKMNWDLLVIDEAHEGVDTYKTDVAFDEISRKFTLHLSGTPFKALANNKFEDDAIYNWTYADEQKMKQNWDNTNGIENPYANLPKLNLFTYQMSEIVKDEVKKGVDIDGTVNEYAFDLNEFFSTRESQKEVKDFVYDEDVDKFLDALTLQKKFPFSTPELRDELKHTLWLLNRVDSAKALKEKLDNHPIFKGYKVVMAVGNGKEKDEESENKNSYDKVIDAIKKYDKTITLSVGQLTTGVTIKQWSAVLMLSSIKSPSLYMQAAFRAQNPCVFSEGAIKKRKENAYVFDFDPARTLIIFDEFANDLFSETIKGRGDVETRKNKIAELLNFFPVIAEDENGEMTELNAEQVLTIPNKIKSVEVVRSGFMSNFLFDNISSVFSASKEIQAMIEKFKPFKEAKSKKEEPKLSSDLNRELSLDENGDVNLTEEYVIGKTADLFGKKIYDVSKPIENTMLSVREEPKKGEKAIDKLKTAISNTIVKDLVETANRNSEYKQNIKPSAVKRIESKLTADAENIVNRSFTKYKIEKNEIEYERENALQNRHESGKTTKQINAEFDEKQKAAADNLQNTINREVNNFVEKAKQETTEYFEKNLKESIKSGVEQNVRDHLRGFSRTIPSFLMAYGNENVTLKNFDKVIPDNVFTEVTGITLSQFRFLRDGGNYTDDETGEEKTFKGHLFNEVVFDDSVKEFLNLKIKLSDYFDEESKEDIFDYIPLQETNQKFTPKSIVKKMADMLEGENPGCYDNPDKTFIDLYMKSGLFITEIVKRLYNSPKLKEVYPSGKERLKHIFEKQVYGLAPTEIIYKIATNYILGFDENTEIKNHNFKQADALPYAKEGRLEVLLDELYGV